MTDTLKNYIVVKRNNLTEENNNYYKQFVERKQVQIVITTMRKYARIDYDFDTLNNADQHILGLSKCNIPEKIKAYVLQYAKENNLPSSRMPKVIGDIAGGFEFFIEDVEKVGNDLCNIISNIVNSGCIEYTTMDELLNALEPEVLDELKRVYGKE